MTEALCLIFIVCISIGTVNNVKVGVVEEKCAREHKKCPVPHYNPIIVLMAGLAIIIAFVTAIMGKYPIAAAALVVSMLIPISYTIKEAKLILLMKKRGCSTRGMLHFQPWWVWGRIVLLGMGKWMHIVMCCTLIGIPFYNMMKNMEVKIDYWEEQDKFRYEYEQVHGQ